MWEWTIMLMLTSNGKIFIESLQKKNTTHLYDQESKYMEVKHGPNNKQGKVSSNSAKLIALNNIT